MRTESRYTEGSKGTLMTNTLFQLKHEPTHAPRTPARVKMILNSFDDLPSRDEHVHISFSGGRTSGYMLYRIAEALNGD